MMMVSQGIMGLAAQINQTSSTCTVRTEGSNGYTVIATGQDYTVRVPTDLCLPAPSAA